VNLTPAQLTIWNGLLASVAEEMGVTLGLTAHSPNIRERRDYSCALFDAGGELVAQAAHIPVHLGSMPEAVRAVQTLAPWQPGDIAIVNDPYLGGTHLPDVTLVAPFFWEGRVAAFLANRAHHADIGGMAPGSMPPSEELYQEGVIVPPLRLTAAGRLNEDVFALILRNVRTPEERRGDFDAQLAALRTGERRLRSLFERYGASTVFAAMEELQSYTERLTRAALAAIPDGTYAASDVIEAPDGSLLPIVLSLRIEGETATFDFSGTAPQHHSSFNAVAAVTVSAAAYCVRCLLPAHAPSNAGFFRPLRFVLPEGSLVNARPPAAVSAGNVETSQRIVDVVMKALAAALPGRIPAASAGTMTNFTFGGIRADGTRFAYYETIPGGAGAGPSGPGEPAIQTHMTNTANTPVEMLERDFPMVVWRFEVRRESGGAGAHRGGDGVVKEVEFLSPVNAAVVANRHRVPPWGLAGGGPGTPGTTLLVGPHGEPTELPAVASIRPGPGTRLRLETPGGGGYGHGPA
jgi:N-methylhydantoinase B